jgi:hypothetical protein
MGSVIYAATQRLIYAPESRLAIDEWDMYLREWMRKSERKVELRTSDFEYQTQTSAFRSRISDNREAHFSVSVFGSEPGLRHPKSEACYLRGETSLRPKGTPARSTQQFCSSSRTKVSSLTWISRLPSKWLQRLHATR